MLNNTVLSFNEIVKNIKLVSNFWIIELIILFISIVLIFLLVFYIIPIKHIRNMLNKSLSETKNKKKLLNQIITQKEIEWEIEEEIKKLNLKD
jgi:predicted Holliday junction resolvase-like endonuclease